MKRFKGSPSSFSAYQPRAYRQLVRTRLLYERITVQETDLAIYTDVPAGGISKEAVIEQRGYLEAYIARHPEFVTTLVPWPTDELAPEIVQKMISAARLAGVGPMAAVAGVIAEQVGNRLLQVTREVVVENGGDVFIHTGHDLTLGVFAGASPLSLKVGLSVDTASMPLGVCTSSGSVGHSLSLGRADAVCIMSSSCALADAAATAIGNRVSKPGDIQKAIHWGRTIAGVQGILIIMADKIGAWGKIKIVPL